MEKPDHGTELNEHLAMALARSTSRRGVLATLCRKTLLLTGIVTVGLSLSEKTPKLTHGSSHCSSFLWCGLCGRPCDACGGTFNTCPTGTSVGSYRWTRCCMAPDGWSSVHEYWDCCKTSGDPCSVSKCSNYCPQDTWCTVSKPAYYCTVVLFVGVVNC